MPIIINTLINQTYIVYQETMSASNTFNNDKISKNIIGTIQKITIQNGAGVSSQVEMMITGITKDGQLQWKRPYPYIDCATCGYGPLGCDCPDGFVQ